MELSGEKHGGKRLVSLSDSDSDESTDIPIIANTESTDHPNPVPLCSIQKQAEEDSKPSTESVDIKMGDDSNGKEEINSETVKFVFICCFQCRESLENPQLSIDAISARTQELMRSVGVIRLFCGFP